MTTLFLAVLVLALLMLLEPKIDVTKDKDVLLWYNSLGGRSYIKINL